MLHPSHFPSLLFILSKCCAAVCICFFNKHIQANSRFWLLLFADDAISFASVNSYLNPSLKSKYSNQSILGRGYRERLTSKSMQRAALSWDSPRDVLLPSWAGFLLTLRLIDCPLHRFHFLDCPYLRTQAVKAPSCSLTPPSPCLIGWGTNWCGHSAAPPARRACRRRACPTPTGPLW